MTGCLDDAKRALESLEWAARRHDAGGAVLARGVSIRPGGRRILGRAERADLRTWRGRRLTYSPAAEFPNDNPALHEGATWLCLRPTDYPKPVIRPRDDGQAASGEVGNAPAHGPNLGADAPAHADMRDVQSCAEVREAARLVVREGWQKAGLKASGGPASGAGDAKRAADEGVVGARSPARADRGGRHEAFEATSGGASGAQALSRPGDDGTPRVDSTVAAGSELRAFVGPNPAAPEGVRGGLRPANGVRVSFERGVDRWVAAQLTPAPGPVGVGCAASVPVVPAEPRWRLPLSAWRAAEPQLVPAPPVWVCELAAPDALPASRRPSGAVSRDAPAGASPARASIRELAGGCAVSVRAGADARGSRSTSGGAPDGSSAPPVAPGAERSRWATEPGEDWSAASPWGGCELVPEIALGFWQLPESQGHAACFESGGGETAESGRGKEAWQGASDGAWLAPMPVREIRFAPAPIFDAAGRADLEAALEFAGLPARALAAGVRRTRVEGGATTKAGNEITRDEPSAPVDAELGPRCEQRTLSRGASLPTEAPGAVDEPLPRLASGDGRTHELPIRSIAFQTPRPTEARLVREVSEDRDASAAGAVSEDRDASAAGAVSEDRDASAAGAVSEDRDASAAGVVSEDRDASAAGVVSEDRDASETQSLPVRQLSFQRGPEPEPEPTACATEETACDARAARVDEAWDDLDDGLVDRPTWSGLEARVRESDAARTSVGAVVEVTEPEARAAEPGQAAAVSEIFETRNYIYSLSEVMLDLDMRGTVGLQSSGLFFEASRAECGDWSRAPLSHGDRRALHAWARFAGAAEPSVRSACCSTATAPRVAERSTASQCTEVVVLDVAAAKRGGIVERAEIPPSGDASETESVGRGASPGEREADRDAPQLPVAWTHAGGQRAAASDLEVPSGTVASEEARALGDDFESLELDLEALEVTPAPTDAVAAHAVSGAEGPESGALRDSLEGFELKLELVDGIRDRAMPTQRGSSCEELASSEMVRIEPAPERFGSGHLRGGGPADVGEEAKSDVFDRFVAVLARVALDRGATRAAAVLPAFLRDCALDRSGLSDRLVSDLIDAGLVEPGTRTLHASAEFRGVVEAWKAALNGDGAALSRCGAETLDEWAAGVLVAFLDCPDARKALRRELRRQGIAAFGMRAA